MAEADRSRGVVVNFHDAKGYGFIKPNGGAEDDADLFVHHSEIKADGHRTLWSGQEVEFEIIKEGDKLKAVDVTIVDEGSGRRAGGRVGDGYNRRIGTGYRGGNGGGGGAECYNCGRTGHIARECDSDRSRGRNGSGGGECYNCGRTGHFARDCEQSNGGSGGVGGGGNSGGCYTCGGYGHMARDCPSGRSGGCYNCGEQGHMAKDCGSARSGGVSNSGGFSRFGGSSRNCYQCGKPGHFARECQAAN